ncbi:DegV family protein [Halalkalibacillus sediminis]|uniref:DegV family protein n=1 Tax=Halalkalibacillus sediminis TaxID=2018042 RepID=UPI002368E6F2|nr:DegV family protein [Halalkalibacillus sediminis]
MFILPLQVSIDGKNYKENVDLTSQEFYQKVKVTNKAVKTSQPALGDIISTFEQIIEQGYEEIICVNISSEVSGTFQSVSNIADDFEGTKIHVVDSSLLSYPMYEMIQHGKKLIEHGRSAEDVVKIIQNDYKKVHTYIYVADIKYAYLGGGINMFAYNVGKTLKVHPILTLKEGKMELVKKVRTEKRSIDYMVNQVIEYAKSQPITQLNILHCNDRSISETIKNRLKDFSNIENIHIGALGPIIAAHGGEGSFALSWQEK